MSETEEKMGMTSRDFSGFVLDPTKCSRLSLTEKRELVHEIAQWTKDAPAILSSFTRRELLEIICAEMGKQRKYSGYSKSQMIEHLLKLVNKNYKRNNVDSSANNRAGVKRQRQKETQFLLSNNSDVLSVESHRAEHVNDKVCQNAACRANLGPDDVFCKRCSCCICHYYDDNKDPSLWLTCGSDSLNDNSCGLTCHLICALKDGRTGIMKIGSGSKLDGSFCCVSCGKINGLMRTWRKQLLIAKEARRIDVLCLRVLLGFRILSGTEKYREMLKSMETALQLLMNELGPLDLVCAKMARGIVNRLSCGADVQKLCASAMEAFDLISTCSSPDNMQKKEPISCHIRFEEFCPTSVVVVLDVNPCEGYLGCKLWHRKSTGKDYPDKPSFIVVKPEKRFNLTDLSPSTEYFCKVSLFSNDRFLGVWEAKWITPPSNGSSVTSLNVQRNQENMATGQTHSQTKTRNTTISSGDQLMQKKLAKDAKKSRSDGLSSLPSSNEGVSAISLEPLSPPTPCKASEASELSSLGCKKQKEESVYDYSVRVVKWLEHEGHIDEDFRVKFLTWFSLKASMQERRVVNVFVDAFIDDPPSLAGQLIHTFMDEICSEQERVPQHGFCSRFWH